jgi:histidinol-phosphate phosphatase family protein
MPNRFVFLDRDGTLVEDHGFMHRLSDYALLPGAIEALQLLRRAGFRLAIVTNQSGIGRGIFGTEDFWAFQRRLLEDLAAADVQIEETYVCPHRPEDGCDCRKPRPGLVWQARDRFSIDLHESWVIGDHASDVALGVAAGCRSILVLTGHGAEERAKLIAAPGPPALIVPDILDAARHIVGGQAD